MVDRAMRRATVTPGQVDRYGWKVRSSVALTREQERQQQSESAAETRREQKWIKMFREWDSFREKKLSKLHERVMKGIPDSLRGKAWQHILDRKFEQEVGSRPPIPTLVAMGRRDCVDTVEVDLARTLPNVAIFSDKEVRDSLKAILHAYTNVDPELGYVQGMGFLAGMLLVYMDEARAFWCFMRLMAGEKFQFRRLYMNDFEGLNLLNSIWELLLSQRFPKVSANFKQKGVMSGLYSTSWFLTAFMNVNFHPALRLRIFDRYVMFGNPAVLSFALVIVAVNEERLTTGGLTQVLTVLQKPEATEGLRDWRGLIALSDKLWVKPKEYEKLFATLNIPLFY
jgi:hypothetical protein